MKTIPNFKLSLSLRAVMAQILIRMYEKTYPSKRFNITLDFLKKHVKTSETIFDLGVPNPFSKIMEANE